MNIRWIHGLWGLAALSAHAGTWQVAVNEPISSLVTPAGDTYLTARIAGESKLQLLAFDGEGDLRWQRPLQASASALHRSSFDVLTNQQGLLAAGGDRICVNRFNGIDDLLGFGAERFVGITSLQCLASSDGSEVFSADAALALAVAADGTVERLIVGSCAGCADFEATRIRTNPDGVTSELLAFDTTGLGKPERRWADAEIAGANAVATFGPGGRASILLGAPDASLTLLAHDGSGSSRRNAAPGESSGTLLRARGLDDGGVLLHSWSAGVHQLRAIATDGSLRWRFTAEGGLDDDSGHTPFAFDVDGAHVVSLAQQSAAGMLHSQVTALDATTGAQIWQHEDLAVDLRGTDALEILAEQQQVLIGRSRPGATYIEALALADGARLGLLAQPCGAADDCAVIGLGSTAERSLRAVTREALSRVELDSITAVAALDQSALSGTWYDPATTGQGMLFEYAPASGDLFGAWFTYADAAVEGAAGLRWYTLGGRIEAEATTLTLDIYRNQGGQFDVLPVTTSDIVGSAQLTLQHCDQLTLSYAFTGGELTGLSGSIPMRRLTPNAFSCIDAEGEVAPTPSEPDLTRGIDRRHTGGWYEPATSGQGFLLDVRPPSVDGSDPGVLVGGWFTYDVAGGADDDQAQHWFLLQGHLSEAQDGITTAVIYGAADGRFDAQPTDNVQIVGAVEVSFSGCSSAQLSYQFSSENVAGSFAGRSGQIPLVRLLPCPE